MGTAEMTEASAVEQKQSLAVDWLQQAEVGIANSYLKGFVVLS